MSWVQQDTVALTFLPGRGQRQLLNLWSPGSGEGGQGLWAPCFWEGGHGGREGQRPGSGQGTWRGLEGVSGPFKKLFYNLPAGVLSG